MLFDGVLVFNAISNVQFSVISKGTFKDDESALFDNSALSFNLLPSKPSWV